MSSTTHRRLLRVLCAVLEGSAVTVLGACDSELPPLTIPGPESRQLARMAKGTLLIGEHCSREISVVSLEDNTATSITLKDEPVDFAAASADRCVMYLSENKWRSSQAVRLMELRELRWRNSVWEEKTIHVVRADGSSVSKLAVSADGATCFVSLSHSRLMAVTSTGTVTAVLEADVEAIRPSWSAATGECFYVCAIPMDACPSQINGTALASLTVAGENVRSHVAVLCAWNPVAGATRHVQFGREFVLETSGQKLFVRQPNQQWCTVDARTGQCERQGLVPPGYFERPLLGWDGQDLLIYEGLVTLGEPQSRLPGLFMGGDQSTRWSWSIKLADIATGEFVTLRSSIGHNTRAWVPWRP